MGGENLKKYLGRIVSENDVDTPAIESNLKEARMNDELIASKGMGYLSKSDA